MTIATRQSIYVLQQQYDDGSNTKPLEDVLYAWMGIQKLGPQNWNSFFVLAGLHGEPFVARDAVDRLSPEDIYPYWGGYCNHGNILFPTWHRMYLYALEKALQSIVPGVMLPFWDETDDYSRARRPDHLHSADGRPPELQPDERTEPAAVVHHAHLALRRLLAGPEHGHRRGAAVLQAARLHDGALPALGAGRQLRGLRHNRSPQQRLHRPGREHREAQRQHHGLAEWPRALFGGDSGASLLASFKACLSAPNYAVFSNTSSAAAWNAANPNSPQVVSLEELPQRRPPGRRRVRRAPDLCWYDRGQDPRRERGHGREQHGRLRSDLLLSPLQHRPHVLGLAKAPRPDPRAHDPRRSQERLPGHQLERLAGPTPGVAPGTLLALETTALKPFRGPTGVSAVSKDCVDIEGQLGYTYGPGSLDGPQSGARSSRKKR